MGTPYSALLDGFYHRVEEDRDFFSYFNLTDQEAMDLAKQRALSYLNESLGIIMLECHPSVNFFDKNDSNEEFNFNLTSIELYVVPSIMYQCYLNRDIAYLKTLSVNYSPNDLRVFSPSEARTSFLKLYDKVCSENAVLLDAYRCTDRETGDFIKIDFSAYDDE